MTTYQLTATIWRVAEEGYEYPHEVAGVVTFDADGDSEIAVANARDYTRGELARAEDALLRQAIVKERVGRECAELVRDWMESSNRLAGAGR